MYSSARKEYLNNNLIEDFISRRKMMMKQDAILLFTLLSLQHNWPPFEVVIWSRDYLPETATAVAELSDILEMGLA